MANDQDTRGFLPPTTTNDLHHQPPSSTTENHPHHLPGFTTTTEESQLAAALALAIMNFRDAVTTTTTGNNSHKNRTKPDVTSRVNQEHAETAVKRNPLHWTVLQSDNNTISTAQKEQQKTTAMPPSPGATTECLDPDESPQIKRLRKMEEMVTEIEERCWELISCESGLTDQEEHHDDDNNNTPQAIVEQDAVREERVQFKRHNDGGVSIRLSCSCGKSFEMLHNHSGCFYRLI